MDLAVCHYSFHRRWTAEAWNLDRLAAETAALGVPAVDLHARMIGDALHQPAAVLATLKRHGVALAGFSLSNNFLQIDQERLKAEIDKVRTGLAAARSLGAQRVRIFGGHLPAKDFFDAKRRRDGLQMVIEGLGAVIREAEESGIVLALENHGNLPGTSGDVLQVLGAIDSPNLRATIDLGNFLNAGEEAHHGAAMLAPYGAYVHVKGMRKLADTASPWGYRIEACTPGEGDVDLVACFRALRSRGFSGTVALEYEGPDDEVIGIPASVAAIRVALAASATAISSAL